jgi:bifunctional DNA-binding transcriptional regulator/antitoxin component of YhaV-PrlF toxin-antitoxin module
VRKALGLKPGDALLLRVEEGRVVLEPAQVLPLEAYTEECIQEFAQAAEVSQEELAAFGKAWGL